ncbi:MAG TPA: Gfo/Idh/MocA family oxidoreductase [Actinomycetota bacterium]|jgi:predicted dehydrogenase|nr:Gfo/Idh/MocA family oxidoreductase [Actinomycetota bacterium]
MAQVTLAVVGAGNRGTTHGDWALANPGRARVVAVSEPRDPRRERFAARHDLPAGAVLADWRELAGRGRVADAVLICTQDAMHVEPAVAFAELGYHLLLEKPMATTEAGCRRIVEAVERAGVLLSVGHVLRYTPYTALVKRVVDAGRLGQVISVQHLEPVGFLHQAHSYVRGPWRREDLATFMLMAKSCHDLDWLQYIVGRPVRRVASFGALTHFRPEQRPAGAADRCLDCAIEPACPYSAVRFYSACLERGHGWPLDAVLDRYTETDLKAALRSGPFGRCVWACDNDVVDHQVVAMEFDGGPTGTFTMTGFNAGGHRRTRLFGTRGELEGDGETVRVHDFLTGTAEVLSACPPGDATAAGGHGGGDWGLMDAFTRAVATGDPTPILSGPRASLDAHLAVFAAERARRDGVVSDVGG